MTNVLFYHLERATLDAVLPDLLEKSRAKGWNAVVKVGEDDELNRLDERLWTFKDDSFLAHGVAPAAEGEEPARCPIWLTTGDDNPNAAQILFLVAGARREIEDVRQFQRCVTIFDGGDDGAVSAARTFWKDAQIAGCDVAYWRQSSSGKWEKQGG
ncbi:MAG: DNA polymerase III subunit chi [Pseudomonadota bacterium]